LDDFLRADNELEELRKLTKELTKDDCLKEGPISETDADLNELDRLLNLKESNLAEAQQLEKEERALLEELELVEKERVELLLRDNDLQDLNSDLSIETANLGTTLSDLESYQGMSSIFRIDVSDKVSKMGRICGLRLAFKNSEENWAELSSALGLCCLIMKSIVNWRTHTVLHSYFIKRTDIELKSSVLFLPLFCPPYITQSGALPLIRFFHENLTLLCFRRRDLRIGKGRH
jgi:hypothetical protein